MAKTAVHTPKYISLRTIEADYEVPYSTLRQWIREGKLPAVKIGKHLRVLVADLEALMRPVA